MNFLLTLRSELYKTKRTASLYLSLLLGAGIPLILFLEYTAGPQGTVEALLPDPWNLHFEEGMQIFILLALPFYLILIGTLLPQLEYRNKAWKQLFSSPQPLLHIFLAKFGIIQLAVLGFIALYILFMGLTLLLMGLLEPELNLWAHSIDGQRFLLFYAKAYVASLGISAIQFWLGMRFRNFVVPVGIGISLWVLAGLLVFEYEWTYVTVFPMAYPILSTFPKYEALADEVLLRSLAYAIGLLALAFMEFNQRKIKTNS